MSDRRAALSRRFLRLRPFCGFMSAVACSAGLTIGLRPYTSSPAELFGLTLLCAVPIALLGAWLLPRPIREVFFALSNGLLSFREQDFSVRLVTGRTDEIADLVARFNALGEMLRSEHNDVYQKEILLETVLEAAPLAVVLCDEGGSIVFANGAARDLFFDGRRTSGRFGDLLAEWPDEMRQAILGARDMLFTLERDGRTETFHLAKRYFELSTLQHVLYLVKPLTRELERQEADIWKKAIRVISHELNNSLAPISSLVHSARTLAARPGELERLDKIFGTIEERARYLRDFLDGYARFARLPKPTPREVPWSELLGPVQALYPFTLRGQVPSEPGFFDPAQLQQAIINLVKNAVEAGGPREAITLEIRASPDGFHLEVEDGGAGMTDEVLKKALLPFYSTKKSGTGLGLPLCREIVESHGGHIAIRRRPEGGMAVTLWLPK